MADWIDNSGTDGSGNPVPATVPPLVPVPINNDATPVSTTIYGLATYPPPLIAPGNMDKRAAG